MATLVSSYKQRESYPWNTSRASPPNAKRPERVVCFRRLKNRIHRLAAIMVSRVLPRALAAGKASWMIKTTWDNLLLLKSARERAGQSPVELDNHTALTAALRRAVRRRSKGWRLLNR